MARAGLPVSVVVGTRFALEPGRGRSAVPVRPALLGAVTGVLGVLGVLAAFTFSSGVADAAENPERFGQTHQLEAFLGFNGEDFVPSQPALAAVAADLDVAGVNDARVAVATVGDTAVTLYTHDPVGAPVPAVLTAGRLPDTAGEVALAPTSARAIGAGVGSVISLTGTSGTRVMTVTGIGFVPVGPHNGYDQGGWLTPGGYQHLLDGFKFHVAQIVVRPGADPESVIPRLMRSAAAAAGSDAVSLRPVEPVPAVAQIRDVEVLPRMLGGFLALLAAGGRACAGHRGAPQAPDVAVLRALGMTRRQARGVVVTQASVLAGIGLLFGVPLGLALGRTLWQVVADATPLLYVPPVAVAALVLIGPLALLVANLLAAPPGQRAARLRIGHVLRAE
ncbi:MAG: FtsX-like permease family protein [Pseudonocardiales bacterium]